MNIKILPSAHDDLINGYRFYEQQSHIYSSHALRGNSSRNAPALRGPDAMQIAKRGYVDLPEHWRYSSARDYMGQQSLLPVVLLY